MKALRRRISICIVAALLFLLGAGSAHAWGASGGTFLDLLDATKATATPAATATPTPKPTEAPTPKATAAPTATATAKPTESAAPRDTAAAPAATAKKDEGGYTVLYQITFYTLDGSTLLVQHLSSDSVLQAADVPQVNGLTFLEWVDVENPDTPVAFGEAPTGSMQLMPRYSVDAVNVPSFEEDGVLIASILDMYSVTGSDTPAPATPPATEEAPSFGDLFGQGGEAEEEEEVDLFSAITSSILGTFESDDSTDEDILNIAAAGMLEAGDYNLYKGDEAFTLDDDSMVSTRTVDDSDAPPPVATVLHARMEQDSGMVMVLRATVSNLPQGTEAAYQWQRDDGEGFVAIEGATSDIYTVDIDEAKAAAWDVAVYLTPAAL